MSILGLVGESLNTPAGTQLDSGRSGREEPKWILHLLNSENDLFIREVSKKKNLLILI